MGRTDRQTNEPTYWMQDLMRSVIGGEYATASVCMVYTPERIADYSVLHFNENFCQSINWLIILTSTITYSLIRLIRLITLMERIFRH